PSSSFFFGKDLLDFPEDGLRFLLGKLREALVDHDFKSRATFGGGSLEVLRVGVLHVRDSFFGVPSVLVGGDRHDGPRVFQTNILVSEPGGHAESHFMAPTFEPDQSEEIPKLEALILPEILRGGGARSTGWSPILHYRSRFGWPWGRRNGSG